MPSLWNDGCAAADPTTDTKTAIAIRPKVVARRVANACRLIEGRPKFVI